MFADIITEVYGYKIARNILWSALLCYFIFSLVAYTVVQLPFPDAWDGQGSYELVFFNIMRITSSTIFSLFFAVFLNSYLLSKWKILVQGRYFWLRSVGSSALGEFIYTVINIFLQNVGILAIDNILTIIFWGTIFKIIYTIVFAYPAIFVAAFLKKAEHSDIYDHETNFNPFKFTDNTYVGVQKNEDR